MDPLADARDLVADRFGEARAAFLGDGVLSPHRTCTSDLDIVVVLRAASALPWRESLRWRDWPAELFVHDEHSLARYIAADTARRRPTLARICADGAVLADHPAGTASRLQQRGRAVLTTGPPPMEAAELDWRRYGLSDLLDDLAGSSDPGETAMLCWNVLTSTAELALLLAGRWLGSGKWLLRELRALDPDLASRLLAAREDPAALAPVADTVLAGAGGRLWEGYRAAGRRTPGS